MFKKVHVNYFTCNIDCEVLSDPANGQVRVTRIELDYIASYTCTMGYALVGNSSRVCQLNKGTWSGSKPHCIFDNLEVIVGLVFGVVVTLFLILIVSTGIVVFKFRRKLQPSRYLKINLMLSTYTNVNKSYGLSRELFKPAFLTLTLYDTGVLLIHFPKQ